jgi:hypothetical protein
MANQPNARAAQTSAAAASCAWSPGSAMWCVPPVLL